MHVIGPAASDIVHQGMIALEFVSSVEDLQLMTLVTQHSLKLFMKLHLL